jgi:hypothetical protein
VSVGHGFIACVYPREIGEPIIPRSVKKGQSGEVRRTHEDGFLAAEAIFAVGWVFAFEGHIGRVLHVVNKHLCGTVVRDTLVWRAMATLL